LELAQKVGDPLRTAEALEGLGNVATEVGDYVSAPERIRQAQALYRQANDADGIAGSDMNLAWAFMRNGDPETAETHLLEALEIFESSGSQPGLGFCLSGLGEAYLRQAKLEQALQALQRSLEIRESLGDKWGTAATLGSLAWAYLETGDLPAAERALKRSLWLRRETGDKGGMAWCLEKLAETLAPAKRSASAVYLYAAAFALRESIHSVIDPADQPAHEARIAALRQSLGQTDFEAEWKRGLSSPREAVIDGILAETPPGV
jgi:tetratricopeptide (TPR) repeat protein